VWFDLFDGRRVWQFSLESGFDAAILPAARLAERASVFANIDEDENTVGLRTAAKLRQLASIRNG